MDMNELLSRQQVALVTLARSRTVGERAASEYRVRHYSHQLRELRRRLQVALY